VELDLAILGQIGVMVAEAATQDTSRPPWVPAIGALPWGKTTSCTRQHCGIDFVGRAERVWTVSRVISVSGEIRTGTPGTPPTVGPMRPTRSGIDVCGSEPPAVPPSCPRGPTGLKILLESGDDAIPIQVQAFT